MSMSKYASREHFYVAKIAELQDQVAEVPQIMRKMEELRQQRDELQAKWDHFQRLCRDHGAHGIGDLIVQRDEYKKQRDELLEALEEIASPPPEPALGGLTRLRDIAEPPSPR